MEESWRDTKESEDVNEDEQADEAEVAEMGLVSG